METAGPACHNPNPHRRAGRPRVTPHGNADLSPSRPLRQPDGYREGLLWLQRYESLTVPGLLLSHQYWADEQALSAWRQNSNHLLSQREGINSIFEDYRIRVGPRLWHWDCDASSMAAWLDHGG